MSEPVTGIAQDRRTPWRWIMLLFVLILIGAFILVPLININRYHRTIADSLSRSLGHPVHLGSVQLQVLPHTGLTVSDFVVEENPGFGAEPILRAPSVLVTLRLSSFWGGHIEPSRIDLDNASVNLVRNGDGQWNFNLLLLQAAHPSASSTSAERTAARHPPYIQFRSARINFKAGAEKKAFSFLNADLAIWLEEPGQWRLRFEGQPARTDLNIDLADTGLIRLDGSLNRAAALDTVPLKVHAEWRNAPLGQVSRMLFGEDSGWRGLFTTETDLAGDLESLHIDSRLRVEDAHRQEFTPLTQLNVDARCRAVYRSGPGTLGNLTCLWPAGDGHLLLTGSVRTPAQPQANLTLEINHTPAEFALSLLALLRRGVTASVSDGGLINGHFTYTAGPDAAGRDTSHARQAVLNGEATLSGEATVDPLTLALPGLERPLALPSLHFTTRNLLAPARGKPASSRRSAPPSNSTPAILLPATPVALGAPTPVQLSAQLTASGFQVRAAGQADLARLVAIVRSSALLGPSLSVINVAGTTPPADIDLSFAGPWTTPPANPLGNPARPATATGSLRIQRAEAKFDWLPEPVEIASATATFAPDRVVWSNAAITINGIAARGSYTRLLACSAPEDCALPASEPAAGHFDLDIPTLDPAALQSALMGAGRRNEFLNAILSQVGRATKPWPPLNGTVHIGSVALADLVFHDAHGELAIRANRLDIASLEAAALGGSVKVGGNLQTGGGKPVYSLNFDWTGVSVPQVAAVFHEKWGTGVLSGHASLTLQGYSAADLADSAHGTFAWDWTRGSILSTAALAAGSSAPAALREASLTRPQSASFSPAHFFQWKANGTISGAALKLDPSAGPNPVSGTINFDRSLDLSWPAANASTLHIGGTLANPVLEPTPESRRDQR